MEAFHVGHATFVFRDRGSKIILDPFFADKFYRGGCKEVRLTQAAARPLDFQDCNAVFVTHDHGDHCDWIAIRDLLFQKPRMYAPPAVIDQASSMMMPIDQMTALAPGDSVVQGSFKIRALQDYRNPPGEYGRAAYWISAGGVNVLFGGDSHGPGADWDSIRGDVDVAVFWPHQTAFAALVETVMPRKVLLMHNDRFEPGDFLCNVDLEAYRERCQSLFPRVSIVIPPRGRWFEL